MPNSFSLQDRVVLITGASSGIGAAAAIVFAELGARIAINYKTNRAGAEAARDEIRANGGVAQMFQADLTRSVEIESLIQKVTENLGPIDILINNAGSLVERLPVLAITEERWDAVLDLNLKSAVLCTRAVVESMMQRKLARSSTSDRSRAEMEVDPVRGLTPAAKGALGGLDKIACQGACTVFHPRQQCLTLA